MKYFIFALMLINLNSCRKQELTYEESISGMIHSLSSIEAEHYLRMEKDSFGLYLDVLPLKIKEENFKFYNSAFRIISDSSDLKRVKFINEAIKISIYHKLVDSIGVPVLDAQYLLSEYGIKDNTRILKTKTNNQLLLSRLFCTQYSYLDTVSLVLRYAIHGERKYHFYNPLDDMNIKYPEDGIFRIESLLLGKSCPNYFKLKILKIEEEVFHKDMLIKRGDTISIDLQDLNYGINTYRLDISDSVFYSIASLSLD